MLNTETQRPLPRVGWCSLGCCPHEEWIRRQRSRRCERSIFQKNATWVHECSSETRNVWRLCRHGCTRFSHPRIRHS